MQGRALQTLSDAKLSPPNTGSTKSEIAAMAKPKAVDSGCDPVDQRADCLNADVDRDGKHRDDDPCLSAALEVFRCDWISSFLAEPPHENDRGG